MAYSTNADIASEFKDITFSATTKVTDTEVDGFIAQTDQEINGIIGVKYRVPITDVTALELLKSISISIVAARVASILRVKTPSPDPNQDSKGEKGEIWGRKMLDKISKGKVLLLDATGDEIELATTHDGIRSFNVDTDQQYTFKKNVDQW